jgi:hypothetical protein
MHASWNAAGIGRYFLAVHSNFGGRLGLAPHARSQRGSGTIKAILWTALLIYGAFVAYRIIPAYVAEYQLSDKMQETARFAVVNHYGEEQIRETIYKTVQDLEIPAKKEAIKVTSTQSVVRISLEYSVPVDLLV